VSEHTLKTWPEPFRALLAGEKTHEIRTADRPFAVGDLLHLREWDPVSGEYSGRSLSVRVTYITKGGEWGIPAGMCVMSVTPEQARIAALEGALREVLAALRDEELGWSRARALAAAALGEEEG
jgi:hypothetical protein